MGCVLNFAVRFLVVFASGLSLGCQMSPLPKADWVFAVADVKGHLLVVTTSASGLFDNPNGVALRQVNTQAECYAGSLDFGSGRIAALEKVGTSRIIRIYNRQMGVIAQYPSSQTDVKERTAASPPVFSAGAKRVAFVDATGSLIVGDVSDGNVEFHAVCGLPDAKHALPSVSCYWIGIHRLAVGYHDRVLIVDADKKEFSQVCEGQLLGVHEESLIISQPQLGIAVFGMDGKQQAVLGYVKSGIPYAGHTIHRISPNREYVAYDASLRGTKIMTIQHIESGRAVRLEQLGGVRWLGSWESTETKP